MEEKKVRCKVGGFRDKKISCVPLGEAAKACDAMTVSQLIEKLEKLDGDAIVLYEYDGIHYSPEEVIPCVVREVWYSTEHVGPSIFLKEKDDSFKPVEVFPEVATAVLLY
jgi:hypothetical protein